MRDVRVTEKQRWIGRERVSEIRYFPKIFIFDQKIGNHTAQEWLVHK